MPESQLNSQIRRADSLTGEELDRLYGLFTRHYDAVSREQFESDFREKDTVILLRDGAAGLVRGFSTQMVSRASHQDETVRVLFSGDTIIDPAYWGEQELVKAWCRLAGMLHAEEPETPFYWFLICKGYRTYLYLPVFFRDYYPRYDVPTPVQKQSLLDSFATAKFPAYYQPHKGLLEFPASKGQLKTALADIPAGRLKDPRVRFFLDKNPEYASGSELVCMTEISPRNMRGLALRMFQEGSRQTLMPAGAP